MTAVVLVEEPCDNNNVGSKTLFKAVFINPEHVVHSLLCKKV